MTTTTTRLTTTTCVRSLSIDVGGGGGGRDRGVAVSQRQSVDNGLLLIVNEQRHQSLLTKARVSTQSSTTSSASSAFSASSPFASTHQMQTTAAAAAAAGSKCSHKSSRTESTAEDTETSLDNDAEMVRLAARELYARQTATIVRESAESARHLRYHCQRRYHFKHQQHTRQTCADTSAALRSSNNNSNNNRWPHDVEDDENNRESFFQVPKIHLPDKNNKDEIVDDSTSTPPPMPNTKSDNTQSNARSTQQEQLIRGSVDYAAMLRKSKLSDMVRTRLLIEKIDRHSAASAALAAATAATTLQINTNARRGIVDNANNTGQQHESRATSSSNKEKLPSSDWRAANDWIEKKKNRDQQAISVTRSRHARSPTPSRELCGSADASSCSTSSVAAFYWNDSNSSSAPKSQETESSSSACVVIKEDKKLPNDATAASISSQKRSSSNGLNHMGRRISQVFGQLIFNRRRSGTQWIIFFFPDYLCVVLLCILTFVIIVDFRAMIRPTKEVFSGLAKPKKATVTENATTRRRHSELLNSDNIASLSSRNLAAVQAKGLSLHPISIHSINPINASATNRRRLSSDVFIHKTAIGRKF